MKLMAKYLTSILILISLLKIFPVSKAFSQSITPAQDGTGTVVAPNGNRIDISGGTLSGDQANLFQSFTQFGLDSNQIANFLSQPNIQNILGRVVGGDPSVINGLLQVTGGNSNLYLLNPSGIIFGSNASLNIPASFTATTADGIGFGSSWFNAVGSNNYAALVGNPNSFAFTMSQPGAIVNAGSLAVNSEQNLSLLGGTVVSTGTLIAPGGQILVSAVPGQSLVRLSQPGNPLSLEIQPIASATSQPQNWALPIATLPQLLTGGNGDSATGLTVNGSGQVELTGAALPVVTGDVTTRNISAGSALLSATNNLTLPESQISTTGDLQLLAADTVKVRDSVASSVLIQTGGNLHLQGNQSVDILALNHPQTPFVSGGNLSLVSDGNVSGDAHFTSGRTFSVLNTAGGPGNFVSLYDPVIYAVGDVQFGDYTGAALKVQASRSIQGGNITITGPDTSGTIPTSDPDFGILTTSNALVLRAGVSTASPDLNQPLAAGGTTFQAPNAPLLPVGSIQVGNIDTLGGGTKAGPVILQATGNIQATSIQAGRSFTSGIAAGGNNVTLLADGDINITGVIPLSASRGINTSSNDGTPSGDINLTSKLGSINIQSFQLTGGNITFQSSGSVQLSQAETVGGAVRITSNTGSINVNGVSSSGGDINFDAQGDIANNTSISSFSGPFLNSDGGNVNLISRSGKISGIGFLTSNGGLIGLDAFSNIDAIQINSQASFKNGGDINLVSSTGSISVDAIQSGSGLRSGDVKITAPATITVDTLETVLPALVNSGGGGSIEITANEINFNDINTSDGVSRVVGNSYIVLQPFSPNQAIAIGSTSDSGNGTLDLTLKDLDALGNGYNNFIDRFSNIIIGRSDSSGQITILNSVIFGDPVTIQSPVGTGAITANGTIAGDGDASITLLTAGDIRTANILTGLNTGRGDINVDSTNGAVTAGNLTSSGGNVTVKANSAVNSSQLNSSGGQITLNSNTSSVTATSIDSAGGDIVITAPTGIAVGNTSSRNDDAGAGDISLTASQGDIVATGGLSALSAFVNGGAISLNSGGKITANSIGTSAGFASTSTGGTGGSITLNAADDINIGQFLASFSGRSTAGIVLGFGTASGATTLPRPPAGLPNAGAISVTSSNGAVTVGKGIDASSQRGAGGAVTVKAAETISAGQIFTRSTSSSGGNVILDPPSNIAVQFIDAQGGTTGGNVDITTNQFFQATGSFSDRNGITSSISTAGGTGSGAITIRHGGNGVTPFIVGDATTNGTLAALTSDATNTISPTQSFPSNYTQGNIQILTNAPPPPFPSTPPVVPPPTPPVVTPEPAPTLSDEASRAVSSQTSAQAVNANLQGSSSQVLDTLVGNIEESFTQEFQQSLGSGAVPIKTIADAQAALKKIEEMTGVKPAIVYSMFSPPSALPAPQTQSKQDTDELELIVVTADSPPTRYQVKGANRKKVLETAEQLYSEISEIEKANTDSYRAPAQKLYQWLISPLEAKLRGEKISNILFVSDSGLRSIPIAALYDGKQFVVEKYSVGLLPSLSLTDTRYMNIKTSEVLGMGASEFAADQNQDALAAVPVELAAITQQVRKGKFFLNKDFTVDNLKTQRQNRPYSIVHLATHVEFDPNDDSSGAYIQLYDRRISLNQVRDLSLYNPPVELLVLSACRSALGDEQAELGFAGLAVKAGVKSATASLWYVSDPGTLSLMTEFYRQLSKAPIKAEALRQAQIAMIRGTLRIEENQIVSDSGTIPISAKTSEYLKKNIVGDLSHPYYWAPFTMIGSPW